MNYINNSHLKTHNLTPAEFKKNPENLFEYELEDGPHTYFPHFIMHNEIYEVKGRETYEVPAKLYDLKSLA